MATADRVYRGLLSAVGFFARGWGPVQTYQSLLEARPRILDRESCSEIVATNSHPITIKKTRSTPSFVTYDGRFTSPLTSFLPGLLPCESEVARFELLLPTTWSSSSRPVYIHLAGTGDHYFWRRRYMTALPLLKATNFGSLLLENPYYGSRKPRQQTRSQLHYVSDLFVMGLALILECQLLLSWLEGEGLGPVGLTGMSMGGHNASLAASLWPKPVAVVPCLSWCTASCVFTEGILSSAVHWDVLEQQLFLSRLGGDEMRRDIFQQMLRRGHEEAQQWREGGDKWRADVCLTNLRAGRGHVPYWNASSKGGLDKDLSDKEGSAVNVAVCSAETAHFKGLPERHVGGEQLQGRRSETAPQPPMLSSTGGQWRTRQSHRSGRKFGPSPETLVTMQQVLDLATHLCYYPVPIDTSSAVFVAAKDDLYIPRQSVTDVRHLWPGCTVRYVDGGHVSSTMLKQADYRDTLMHTMNQVLMTSTAHS